MIYTDFSSYRLLSSWFPLSRHVAISAEDLRAIASRCDPLQEIGGPPTSKQAPPHSILCWVSWKLEYLFLFRPVRPPQTRFPPRIPDPSSLRRWRWRMWGTPVRQPGGSYSRIVPSRSDFLIFPKWASHPRKIFAQELSEYRFALRNAWHTLCG